jgi:hypothetical protein
MRWSARPRSAISSAVERLHALGAERLDVERRERRCRRPSRAQQLVG